MSHTEHLHIFLVDSQIVAPSGGSHFLGKIWRSSPSSLPCYQTVSVQEISKRAPTHSLIYRQKTSHQLHFSVGSSPDQLHFVKVVEIHLQLPQLARRLFVCGTKTRNTYGSSSHRYSLKGIGELLTAGSEKRPVRAEPESQSRSTPGSCYLLQRVVVFRRETVALVARWVVHMSRKCAAAWISLDLVCLKKI